MGIISRFFLLLILLFSFSGCATLLNNDGRQSVEITTENNATFPVIIYEGETYKNKRYNKKKRTLPVPATVPLLIENSDITITNHPCFEPAFDKDLDKEFDYTSLLNISLLILGDLNFVGIGFAIDALTGQMWQYEEPVILPDQIYNPECEDANETLRASYEPKPNIPPIETIDAVSETPPERPQDHLANLTGIMFTRYGGLANVTSSITDESGKEQTIAAGNQAHEGYQLAFRNPARQKLLYYAFVPRIMQHRITIADFRETIPGVEVEGKTTIPYVVTAFGTEQEIDPLDPNRYTIRMDAGGIDLVGGSSVSIYEDFGTRFLLTVGLSAGVTLAEYQHIDLELGRDRVEENRFRGLHAYQGGIDGYLLFPDMANLFMEFGYHYIHYPSLDLPQKVEFKNSTSYNETKQIFERERVFVDDVELEITTFSFSMGVLF